MDRFTQVREPEQSHQDERQSRNIRNQQPGTSNQEVHSILIIKLSSLGDVALTSPLVHHLRIVTGARISWLVDEGIAPLLEGHPDVDEILLFPRDPFAGSWGGVPRAAIGKTWSLFSILRQRSFDLAIDVQGRGRSYLALLGCRARRKIGRGRFPFLNETLPHRRQLRRHAVESQLEVLDLIGVPRPLSPVRLRFPTTPVERERIDHKLSGALQGQLAVLFPATTWPSKRWPQEYWVTLAKQLSDDGFQVVVAGSACDMDIQPRFHQALHDHSRCHLCFGTLDLKELTALVSVAQLVVASDSGPMHLASAGEAQIVALFGPTDPARTGPWPRGEAVILRAPGCRTCLRIRCSMNCMERLDPANVISAARGLTTKVLNQERREEDVEAS